MPPSYMKVLKQTENGLEGRQEQERGVGNVAWLKEVHICRGHVQAPPPASRLCPTVHEGM